MARVDRPQSELVASTDPTGGNDDFNNFSGQEGTNWAVLADLRGPGTLTRFWTTGGASASQRLQFYFDGERHPRIDATVADLRKGEPPFLPALTRYEQSCWYTFVPMPYRKRLRILAETGNFTHQGWPRLFYQLNYSRLPEGASVESFPADFNADDASALESYGAFVSGTAEAGPVAGSVTTNGLVTIPPGGEAALLERSGSGIVRDLSLRIAPAARDRLTLKMRWDGAAEPSVDVPLNAFFGKLWQSPDFACAWLSTSGEVSRCRLPMPYATAARISVSNAGPASVTIAAEAVIEPRDPSAALGALHAVWHRSGVQDRGRPHTIARAQGRGKFVGCLLGISSQDPSWWALEGDESIRIDTETRPGWLGTGLEDYFSGAWYYKNNLVRPQHGLVFKRPFTTVQYRFHLVDARRFDQAMEMLFERGPDQNSPATMASVAYYYLAEPQAVVAAPDDPASAAPPPDPYAEPALMSTLANFERLGDYAGASAVIDRHLAAQAPLAPDADILELRQIAYRERQAGIGVARPLYDAFLNSHTNEPAVSYARLLLWFHESPDHALLGLSAGTPMRACLDTGTVGEVNHPQAFAVFPVTLAPGRHVLSLQAFRGAGGPEWVQAGLRTHQGLMATDPTWQFAFDPTGGWRRADFTGAWPPTADSLQEGPPPLPYVATQPHPFVDLQSIPWGIWAPVAWPDGARSVVFRMEFACEGLR